MATRSSLTALVAQARHLIGRLRGMPRVLPVVAAPLAVAAVASGVLATNSAQGYGDLTVPVKHGAVVAAVTADGSVQSPEEVDLGFATGGRIVKVAVSDGQHVRRGQLLARLQDRPQRGRLSSAQANLASARARLHQVETGLTAVERAEQARLADQSRVAVSNAGRDLADARNSARTNVRGLRRTLARARVSGEEADLRVGELRAAQQHAEVRLLRQRYRDKVAKRDADQQALEDALARQRRAFNREPEEQTTQTRVMPCATPPCNSRARTETARQPAVNRADEEVNVFETRVNLDENDVDDADQELINAVEDEHTFDLQVDSRRTALRNARRDLGDAGDSLRNGIASARQQIDTARDSLATTQTQLQVTLAQNRVGAQVKAADVAAAIANVSQALAGVDDGRQALADTELRAPTDGVVGHVDAKVGQVVGPSVAQGLSPNPAPSPGAQGPNTGAGAPPSSPTTTAAQAPPAAGPTGQISGAQPSNPLITLSPTPAQLIKANFDESDADAIRPGFGGVITADALPGKRFAAHVVSVDPIATVVNNVVTYKVTLGLDRPVPQLRPGMSTTAHVTVDRRDDVLTVPRTAIRSPQGATPMVVVVGRDGKREPRMVITGLQNDSAVQVLSGVGAGERVLRALSPPPTG